MRLISIVLLAAIFSVARAGDTAVTTKYPTPTFGELDAISSADVAPLDSSDYSTRTVIVPDGRKNLTISASFSTPSATASIGIIWGKIDEATGLFKPDRSAPGDWATFTADGTYKVNNRYVSRSSAFDSENRKAGILYVRSISAGSVLVGWSLH